MEVFVMHTLHNAIFDNNTTIHLPEKQEAQKPKKRKKTKKSIGARIFKMTQLKH